MARVVVTEAHAHGKLAVAHATSVQNTLAAVRAGVDGLVHTFMDQPPTDEVVQTLKRAGVFVIPTLVTLGSMASELTGQAVADDDRARRFIPDAWHQNLCTCWQLGSPSTLANAKLATGALHRAGVRIVAGTDAADVGVLGTAHGVSLHQELSLLVECGLTPVEALTAATSAAADSFRLPDRGRLAPGCRQICSWSKATRPSTSPTPSRYGRSGAAVGNSIVKRLQRSLKHSGLLSFPRVVRIDRNLTTTVLETLIHPTPTACKPTYYTGTTMIKQFQHRRTTSRATIAAVLAVVALIASACSSSSKSTADGSSSTAGSASGGSSANTAAASSGLAAMQSDLNKFVGEVTSYPSVSPVSGVSALKGKTVWYIPVGAAVPILSVFGTGIQQALAKVGINFHTCDGKFLPTSIAACLNEAATQGADGVVAGYIDYKLVPTAFDNLVSHHIPVLVAGAPNDSGKTPSKELAFYDTTSGVDQLEKTAGRVGHRRQARARQKSCSSA